MFIVHLFHEFGMVLFRPGSPLACDKLLLRGIDVWLMAISEILCLVWSCYSGRSAYLASLSLEPRSIERN